ncbi:MAG: carbon starvation CstA family protein [Prevotellaceae bacterium]|nr:carbon starvation CstA family protein [Prevotellaceae bacterium]
MVSFTLSLIALILGYFIYGKFVENVFGPNKKRKTPGIRKFDGVDYLVLPSWKVFMIQFLNIAGTGPIFGAIMGMWFGVSSYLWIVFGCIFAGATHDYLSGMISTRKGGISLPDMVGQYLGPNFRKVMLVFSLLLLVLVGAVFVLSPATLLANMMPKDSGLDNLLIWIIVIFAYYIIATMMPVDKIIGKIYPLFAFALIFMALALMVTLFIKWPTLPELWDGLGNLGTEKLGIKDSEPIFPALFITIACGAISGFHATQSPLMARCIREEKLGRPVFYGSMITEGIVALIWATISSWFFYDSGWHELCPDAFLAQNEKTLTQFFTAPQVVMTVCEGWLGVAGGILAVLGVVAAPITSGDTALRSARLIIADTFNINQRSIIKRLMVCAPLFILCIALLVWQMGNPDSFNTIWKYFGWANQTLSVFTLWTITVYLALKKKLYIIMLIPAIFMTFVCTTFLLISKTTLGLPTSIGYTISITVTLICIIYFFWWHHRKFRLTYAYGKAE